MEEPRRTNDVSFRPGQEVGRSLPLAPPRLRGRRLAGLLIAAGFLALAATSGLLADRYMHSPTYSLVRISTAVDDRDWDAFQRYVDTNAIVTAFVDQAMAKALGDTKAEGNPFAGLGAMMAQGMKPTLVTQMKQALERSITKGDETPKGNNASLLTAMRFEGKPEVRLEGDVADVTLRTDGGKPGTLRVRMRRAGDHWHVVQILNIEDFTGGR